MTDEPTAPERTTPGRLTDVEIAALALARDQVVSTPLPGPMPARLGLTASGGDHVSDAVRRAASNLTSHPLQDVLEARRSHNAFGPLGLDKLLAVLVRSYRIQDAGTDGQGAAWSLRPVPSAGATHAIDLLVIASQVDELEPGRYLFNAHRGGLHRLDPRWCAYADKIEKATLLAAHRTDPAPASIVLVADAARITARYSAALTLLLRDAGALLQTMHLVATDLGLASRILGTAGHTTHDSGHDSNQDDQDAAPECSYQCGPSSTAPTTMSRGSFIVDCGALLVGSAQAD